MKKCFRTEWNMRVPTSTQPIAIYKHGIYTISTRQPLFNLDYKCNKYHFAMCFEEILPIMFLSNDFSKVVVWKMHFWSKKTLELNQNNKFVLQRISMFAVESENSLPWQCNFDDFIYGLYVCIMSLVSNVCIHFSASFKQQVDDEKWHD